MTALPNALLTSLAANSIDTAGKLRKYATAEEKRVLADDALFDELYNYLYAFCSEPGQKTMPMEVRLSFFAEHQVSARRPLARTDGRSCLDRRHSTALQGGR